MDERTRFIGRLIDGERMSDLCREFGISRKTGHKFRSRYIAYGVRGLSNESRRPAYHPHRTPKEIEDLIINLRKAKPTWGPKKLKARLESKHPGLQIPASSTIGEVLKRYNIPLHKKRRKRHVYHPTGLRESFSPNDIWCVDFKGQFRLGNRKYCYPLTISDHYSRYLLGCEALESTGIEGSMSVFENIFSEYGLPKVIRSDNGVPFAARSINGWSKMSVWWLRLGIELERIEPGHPEQNGRHERMHWTLKQEATRPSSLNSLKQQERFDDFRDEYNNERPHEALQMKTPSSVYKPSEHEYPKTLVDLDYPLHDHVCEVHAGGSLFLPRKKQFYLSSSLIGEKVGLREVKPQLWLVTFLNYDLGFYDENKGKFYEKEYDPPILNS
jgi:putative transposase